MDPGLGACAENLLLLGVDPGDHVFDGALHDGEAVRDIDRVRFAVELDIGDLRQLVRPAFIALPAKAGIHTPSRR